MPCDVERVLVTGGAGFIGSHTVDRLFERGYDVVVVDDLSGGHLKNVNHHRGKANFRFVEGDIREVGLVRQLVDGVDAVVHEAAFVSVQRSIANPLLVNDVNVGGTLNLLKTASDLGVKRFVYASSCAVYGDTDKRPINEGHSLNPISPYGASKLAGETYVKAFSEVFGLETVCLRYFNVYGPRQAGSAYGGVITNFFMNLKENRALAIFGDGKQTRDFVHVSDVAEANVLALERDGVSGEVFNIASGVATTVNHLAAIFRDFAPRNVEIVHTAPRKGDIRHSHADLSKARTSLEYKSTVSLREGLEKLRKNKRRFGKL